MNSRDDSTQAVLVRCSICNDGKAFKGQRGLAIHHARQHKSQAIVDATSVPTNLPSFSSSSTSGQANETPNEDLFWKNLAVYKKDVRIIKRIPRGARISVARSLTECMAKVVAENSFIAWKDFLTFSYSVLHVHNNNNNTRSLTSKIKLNTVNIKPPILSNNSNSYRKNLTSIVENKLSDGDIRGAAKLLFSNDSLAANCQETLSALREKHPPAVEPQFHSTSPLSTGSQNQFIVTEEATLRAILSFPNGSASGLDGISPQHLKDLTGTPLGETGKSLITQLTALLNLMLSGKVHDKVTPILYGANLVALNKKDGGIRPIAVGNTVRRLASKLCCYSFRDKLTNKFQPQQLGFGIKGGCEAAVHAARTFLNSKNYEVFIKIDVKNAFNSVDRDAMLSEIKNELPEIYQYLWQCYGTHSKLCFGVNEISSCTGCQQGDPLGPALFGLAIHPIISSLKSKFNLWYLDDGSLGGNASEVLQDLDTVIKWFNKIGLIINHKKCEIFMGADLSQFHKNEILQKFNVLCPNILEQQQHNLTLLGAPIFEDAIPTFVNNKLDVFRETNNRLFEIQPHMAMFILRFCLFTPKFMYLLRCSPIWKFPLVSSAIDQLLRYTVSKIINLQFSDRSWGQAVLPISYGGLGIRSTSSVALPAFLSSLHSTLPLIGKILIPSLSSDLEVAYLVEAESTWSARCPNIILTDKKTQRAWDSPLLNAAHKLLLEDCSNDADRARILAVSEKESGHWLHALPSKHIGTVLDAGTLRACVGLRLGSKLYESHICPCGRDVDQLGHHGLSCSKSAGRIYRHFSLNDLIRRALATASVPSTLEPTGMSRDDGKRPDGATLVPWCFGRSLIWDATCVDTLAPSHTQSTSIRAGAAAEQAQNLKRRKYSNLSKDYEFAAFAVETMGPWSSDTNKLVREISTKLIGISGDPRAGSYFAQRISLAVQRGNAASVLGTMPQGNILEGVFFL